MPNNWYVAHGNEVAFYGKDFPPNEEITVAVNGNPFTVVRTDAQGSLTHRMTAPTVAGDHVYTFIGTQSHVRYQFTLHVY